jgi:hypothetical protein
MVQSQPQGNSLQDPISKTPNTKKGLGRVAQAVQHLSNKHEALSLNPSTIKSKTKKLPQKQTKNHNLPIVCLPSSWDYRCEPPYLDLIYTLHNIHFTF